jgi:hypothetical protein
MSDTKKTEWMTRAEEWAHSKCGAADGPRFAGEPEPSCDCMPALADSLERAWLDGTKARDGLNAQLAAAHDLADAIEAQTTHTGHENPGGCEVCFALVRFREACK